LAAAAQAVQAKNAVSASSLPGSVIASGLRPFFDVGSEKNAE
jgi:hypothetical protein